MSQSAEEPRFFLFQKVRVLDGPFKDFIGEVIQVDQYDEELEIMVNAFTRNIVLHLKFDQVTEIV
jgi:transcription antitermination factor NusG